jgi:2-polyprenyl-3-methyl-5-hydroxy-6-metoxy-1,4-benzoquinol methylase
MTYPVGKMNGTACPLCAATSISVQSSLTELLKLNGSGRQIVCCTGCRFKFLHPCLSDTDVRDLYNTNSDYFDSYVGTPYLEIASEKLPYYRQVSDAVEGRLGRKGRILDIGCATGHFLSVFKNSGWDVQGIEVSDWCRKYAEREFGIPSIKATVETADLPNRSFDVISLNHVLEHLSSPAATIQRLGQWLSKDGLLCIEVPNEFNDMIFQISGIWGRRRLYNLPGPIWHHQLFFTPKHLRHLLNNSGFSVLETRTSSWRAPVPCHLFKSPSINQLAKLVRKSVLLAGSLFEKGELIFCLAAKRS